jgi:hypothetical protein
MRILGYRKRKKEKEKTPSHGRGGGGGHAAEKWHSPQGGELLKKNYITHKNYLIVVNTWDIA